MLPVTVRNWSEQQQASSLFLIVVGAGQVLYWLRAPIKSTNSTVLTPEPSAVVPRIPSGIGNMECSRTEVSKPFSTRATLCKIHVFCGLNKISVINK